MFDTQIAPAVLGQDATAIRPLMHRLSQQLHLFGTNGPHTHALSALDIALWDIAGKQAGLPIWRLLGADRIDTLPAYASLLRYSDARTLAAACERTAQQGYGAVKLHEITVDQVRAARAALGPNTPLMMDVNCPWSIAQAREMARSLTQFDLAWLEEPVWPPDDHAGLAQVRAAASMPIAAGENTAGLHGFRSLFERGAVDIAQPSVTKIGGISAVQDIAALARAFGVRLVAHCAYFGAGHLASLHLAAAFAPDQPFERLFIDLEDSPYHDLVLAPGGRMRVPDGPGLGRDPDMDVIRRYQVGQTTRLVP